MDNYSVVGKRIKNRDATSKVTGKATFTGDIKLRGMLFGNLEILASPCKNTQH